MLDHPLNVDLPPTKRYLPATIEELAKHFRVSVEDFQTLEEDDLEELRIIRCARPGCCKPE